MQKIELLAPAGDLDRLKTAVMYGADAVFIVVNVFHYVHVLQTLMLKILLKGYVLPINMACIFTLRLTCYRMMKI